MGKNEDQDLQITEPVSLDLIFFTGGKEMPLLAKQPIKSLGWEYRSELSDRQMGKAAQKQLSDGMVRVDQIQLPRKYKMWCYQLILYQRVMQPLRMCEITSS